MHIFIDVTIKPVLMGAIITVWSVLYFISLCTNFQKYSSA
jgi:hypothetical protein